MRGLDEQEIRRRVLDAVRRIRDNDYSEIPPRLLYAVLAAPVAPKLIPATRPVRLRRLSPRETEILGAVSHGLRNQEIAELLGLAEDTIKTHMVRAMRKLAAKNRTHAACIGLREGLIR